MVSAISVPAIPIVTIFVRHHKDCPRKEDHFYKACKCRKRLRWSHDGKQKDVSAKTRSWAEAEKAKQELLDKFRVASPGAVRVEAESSKTIERAIALFLMSKRNGGVGDAVLKKYERELERMSSFLSKRSKLFPSEITPEDLTEFQSGWAKAYPSKQTRRRVLTRYRAFLRYCLRSQWITQMLEFDKIEKDKPDDLPTIPLTDHEYEKLLKTISKTFPAEKSRRVHALVQLMRYSGLAIRDAVTLERDELKYDTKKKLYRVTTSRQKTGTHVSVPIPPNVAKEILAVPNKNPEYFFWNTGTGKPQSAVTNWQHDLRELFRAAGFPEGHPHQLRDTFAVGLLSKGVPIEEVSKLLGHESIKTTEKFYAKWIVSRQDRADALVVGTW